MPRLDNAYNALHSVEPNAVQRLLALIAASKSAPRLAFGLICRARHFVDLRSALVGMRVRMRHLSRFERIRNLPRFTSTEAGPSLPKCAQPPCCRAA